MSRTRLRQGCNLRAMALQTQVRPISLFPLLHHKSSLFPEHAGILKRVDLSSLMSLNRVFSPRQNGIILV